MGTGGRRRSQQSSHRVTSVIGAMGNGYEIMILAMAQEVRILTVEIS